MPQLRLSHHIKSQDAIKAIAQQIIADHNHQGGAFPQHAVFEVSETETLANALQFFMDGGNVDLAVPTNVKIDENFNFNAESLINGIDVLFENDLNPSSIDKLPDDHPFKLVQKLKLAGDNKELKLALQQILMKLVDEIKSNSNQFIIHDKTRVEKVEQQNVFLNGAKGNHRVRAGFFVHRSGNILKVDSLDMPPALNEPEGVKAAKLMHETMVRSAKYRDEIEKSMKDFVQKPSVDSDNLFTRIQTDRPKMPEDQRPRVCVVGLGPAGAFAAIKAYKEGAIVTGVEKRTSYSRNNTFRFTPEVIDQLIALFVEKKEDIDKLSPDHPLRKIMSTRSLTEKRPSPLGDFYAITIKDFEYLVNVWLDMVASRDPQGLIIHRGYSYVAGSLQRGKNEILITDSMEPNPPASSLKKIPTDFVVASDGYRSQCRTDCGIVMEEMSTGIEYATFTYHPKRGDENALFQSLLKTGPRKPMDIQKLKALGWDQERLPVPRYFNTGEHPYLGIEIPATLAQQWREKNEQIKEAHARKDPQLAYKLKEERDSAFDKWGRATLEMFLTEPEIKELVFKECSVIDVKLMRANKSATVLSNCAVVLVGDAAQAAHFQTGRGAITGLEEANEVGTCVEGLCQRKPVAKVVADFEKVVERKTLSLHELAFHFPTKEDLRVQATDKYKKFRQDVRVNMLKEDYASVKPENTTEAQVKASQKVTNKKR